MRYDGREKLLELNETLGGRSNSGWILSASGRSFNAVGACLYASKESRWEKGARTT